MEELGPRRNGEQCRTGAGMAAETGETGADWTLPVVTNPVKTVENYTRKCSKPCQKLRVRNKRLYCDSWPKSRVKPIFPDVASREAIT